MASDFNAMDHTIPATAERMRQTAAPVSLAIWPPRCLEAPPRCPEAPPRWQQAPRWPGMPGGAGPERRPLTRLAPNIRSGGYAGRVLRRLSASPWTRAGLLAIRARLRLLRADITMAAGASGAGAAGRL